MLHYVLSFKVLQIIYNSPESYRSFANLLIPYQHYLVLTLCRLVLRV